MAKTCWLEREKRKSKCVAKYAAQRAEMKKKGVTFQTEPRPFTNAAGQNMKISFVVGPDDVRIEVVQPKA